MNSTILHKAERRQRQLLQQASYVMREPDMGNASPWMKEMWREFKNTGVPDTEENVAMRAEFQLIRDAFYDRRRNEEIQQRQQEQAEDAQRAINARRKFQITTDMETLGRTCDPESVADQMTFLVELFLQVGWPGEMVQRQLGFKFNELRRDFEARLAAQRAGEGDAEAQICSAKRRLIRQARDVCGAQPENMAEAIAAVERAYAVLGSCTSHHSEELDSEFAHIVEMAKSRCQ